jgi:DNA uptake protein ComE-like DNA-binding protein
VAAPPPPTSPGYDPAAAEQRVREKVEQVRHEGQRIGAEADRRIEAEHSPGAATDLGTAQQRLEQERQAQERSIAEVEERLRQVEERTQAAEQRAAEAKRLETLRTEEEARGKRLEQMRHSVAEAEERAREAERRAAEAEQAAVRSVQGQPPQPVPPAPELGPPVPPDPAPTPPPPTPPPPAPEPPPPVPPPAAAAGAQINLNTVTFEQLREQNLSVTQATRLLAHRERLGGFQSVDDLDHVVGFPEDVLFEIKRRSTV